MTSIPIEALKEMTIGKICELIKQAEKLPEKRNLGIYPFPYQEPKTQTAQEIIDEIEGGGN